MGGTATIVLVGASERLLESTTRLVLRCEELWSRFIPTSDVSALNWSEGAAVVVDALTARLLAAMRDGMQLTGGDYDPTLLPLLLQTGYTTSAVDPTRVTTLPDSALAPGRLSDAVIDGMTVTLPCGTTVDPGGIGKGLAADLACEFAIAGGAWGVMVELGGDIVVAGSAPEGDSWRLGVENPFDTSRYSAYVRLGRGALVTSSQRKRRFDTAGQRRHHLLDPRAGGSARTAVQTVSVIATTGARAEALTKPGFLRDTADYLAWLPEMGAAGLVIDESGLALASGNWERYA
ncbi:FAD:protein FMN transferase [soil metagenome]